jgi:radical SAM superfamily enzyme
LGIHLIFGNPDETDERVRETARRVNDLPISNIKLHNLHVLKETTLEKIYHQGQFQPIEFETYARRVQIFLEHISPRFSIQRLAAYASRWEELVAPQWTADKMRTHQGLIDHLRQHQSYQSKFYTASNEKEVVLQNELRLQSSAEDHLQIMN